MRELVQKLVDDIRKLPKPISFLALSEITTPHRLFFYAHIIPPAECVTHWRLLKSIIDALDKWKDVSESIEKTATLQKSIDERSERLAINRATITSEEKQIVDLNKIISEQYPALHEAYAAFLTSVDPLKAVPNCSDSASRLEVLSALEEFLLQRQYALKLENMRLVLNEKSNRRNEIAHSLELLAIDISSVESQALSTLIEKKQQRYNVLANLEKDFKTLHPAISSNLAAPNVELMIAQLKVDISAAELAHFDTKKSLNSLAINQLDKETLQGEYFAAADKVAFVESKKAQLDWEKSSLNPSGILRWVISKDDLAKLNNSYNFVNLFHKDQLAIRQLESLKEQLRATIPQSNIVLPTDDELILEAIRLLEIYDNNYSSSNKSLQILLKDIVDSTNPLLDEKDTLQSSIALLSELQEIDTEILRIRTAHSLIFDEDDAEISLLQKASSSRQVELQELDVKLNTLKCCVDSLSTMMTLEDHINKLKRTNKAIATKNKRDSSALAKVDNDELREKSPQMHAELDSLHDQLLSLPILINITAELPPPIPVEIEIDLPQESVIVEPSVSDNHSPADNSEIINPYKNNLDRWNNKIHTLTHLLPNHLSQWYEKLFKNLQTKAGDDASYYQICQLLRDIYFELEHPVNGDNFSVLRAYQQMSADPDRDCQAIIDTKLPFPVDMPRSGPFAKDDIKDTFDNLYAQQLHLEKKHPREALLLLQATHNLHHLAIASPRERQHPALQNLRYRMNDPRYKSLHQHRGFLKVCEWLAKLCRYLSSTPQIENGYRQSFFFVPTRSAKLLETTVQEVVGCNA
jgi:hypothetical protein